MRLSRQYAIAREEETMKEIMPTSPLCLCHLANIEGLTRPQYRVAGTLAGSHDGDPGVARVVEGHGREPHDGAVDLRVRVSARQRRAGLRPQSSKTMGVIQCRGKVKIVGL